MSLMAAATSWWSRQRRRNCSAGRRRWSIITTTPSSHATVGTTSTSSIYPGHLAAAGPRLTILSAMIPVEEALEIVLREAPALPAEDVALDDALCRVLAEDVAADRDLPALRPRGDGRLRAAGRGRGRGAGGPRGHRRGAGRAVARPHGRPGPGGAHHDRGAGPARRRRRPAGREDAAARRVPGDDPVGGRGGRERGAPRLRGPGGGRRPRARPGDRPGGDRGARLRRASPRARRAAARRGAPRHRRRDRRCRPRPARRRSATATGRRWPPRRGSPVRRCASSASPPTGRMRSRRRCAPGSPPTCSSSPAASRPATTTSSSRRSSSSGATFLFTKVAIKPGAPLVFGRRGETLVFGLPGNPVSAQVTFDLFVRPALLKMQGATRRVAPAREVELLGGVKNRSGRKSHVPARVRFEGGRLVARPLRSMGSGDLAAHARANALVVIEADRRRPRPARPPRPCCSAASWRTTVRHSSVGRPAPGPPGSSLSHLDARARPGWWTCRRSR